MHELIVRMPYIALFQMSLANRECNDITNQYLWKRLSITNHPSGAIADATRMMVRDLQRVRWIHEIRIQVDMSHMTAEDARSECDTITEALQQIPNLKYLEIEVDGQYAAMATSLSSREYTFRLSTFRTNLYAEDGLCGFFAAQSYITTYRHSPRRTHPDEAPIPVALLPRISFISYPPIGIAEMARGRPIQTIETDLFAQSHVDNLFDAVAASTVDVTHLRLRIGEESIVGPLFSGFATRARDLKSLGVTLRNQGAFREIGRDVSILKALASCPSLESIMWRGFLIPESARTPSKYCCPTLQVVYVERPGPLRSATTEYRRQGDEWHNSGAMNDGENRQGMHAISDAASVGDWHLPCSLSKAARAPRPLAMSGI